MTDITDPRPGGPDSGQPSKRAPRANVLLRAEVEHFGEGAMTTHRVRDLSSGGMRIDQAHLLRQGATVLVTVGALEAVGATVVWVADGWAGLKFARAIDPDQARARAVIRSRAGKNTGRATPASLPGAAPLKAGWAGDMRNPYRR